MSAHRPRGYPTVRQLIEAAQMIHPDYPRVRDRPAVQRAAKAYRKAWLAHDGGAEGGRRVKAAEVALNEAVEDCFGPTPMSAEESRQSKAKWSRMARARVGAA